MQTRPARADRREVDLRRLVAGFLRMAPDVAIVGEVRDREAPPVSCSGRFGHLGRIGQLISESCHRHDRREPGTGRGSELPCACG